MPWPLPQGDADLLALAKSYPFASRIESYLLRGGEAVPLASLAPDQNLFAGRHAVIAHGSNRSPEQLRRKFGDSAEIPVIRAWLSDYDVVYSAHVTRYGAVAANLHHSPGTHVEVFVTWLTQAQLERMHETELGGEVYAYGRMDGIALRLEAGPAAQASEAFAYLSRRGCLGRDGNPLSLTAVAARQRRHPGLSQTAALDLVRARHGDDISLDALILRSIRDVAFRHRLIAAMADEAVPTAAPHFHALRG